MDELKLRPRHAFETPVRKEGKESVDLACFLFSWISVVL